MQAPKPQVDRDGGLKPLPTRRRFASFLAAAQLWFGLHSRVVQFLVTLFRCASDPTLVFLDSGTFPVTAISYFYGKGEENPRLGGK